MGLFEGKSTTERNKMIAAGVLGLVALIALYLAFGRNFFGSSTSVAVNISPTPRPSVAPPTNRNEARLPSPTEQDFAYQTTPVDYRPGSSYAPDAGRNIFAFYEPPPPCPTCPTPVKPTPTPLPPVPVTTPQFLIAAANPQAIYAGSKGFRLEVIGDRFTADSHIYFNQSELPTKFINGQRLEADISTNLIAQEGARQIIVQTPDGKSYSNQVMLNVQAAPKPGFQYIGMIGRKRYNNDTAYFTEMGIPAPFGARLNDIVDNRFRLIDISPTEVVLEDTTLGFKHRVPITKGTTAGGQPGANGIPNNGGFVPFDPAKVQNGNVPGFPGLQQQPQQPQRMPKKDTSKDDVDDNGDGG